MRARDRRTCRDCGAQFPKAYERCPQCGTVWSVSWAHRLVGLLIVTILMALLYWIIVRYLLPPHGQVGLGVVARGLVRAGLSPRR